MKKISSLKTLLLIVSLLITSGCRQDYGKMLTFNGGELYYTSSVTENEANTLGQYLVTQEFFDGNEKSVQINKNGNTYEFRMVIKKGLENDDETIELMKQFSYELSTDVFNGKQVDVHLCDDEFETLRVVVALQDYEPLQDYGKMLTFNGGELYYTSSVTENEANTLGQYLVTQEYFDGNEKSVQINKNGNTYEFRMVMKKGLENDDETIELMKQFSRELSTDVFNGKQVDMHLCDDELNTLRVVVAH